MQNGANQDGMGNQSSSATDERARDFSDVADDIKERAKAAKSNIREQAEARADYWRDGAIDAVAQVAGALNAAASTLEDGQPWLARPVARMADHVDEFATSGRDKSLGELRTDIEEMTRHNPVLVVGGAIALGFALSRVLKSSSSNGADGYRPAQPGAADRQREAYDDQ
jgi:hypothetical protein